MQNLNSTIIKEYYTKFKSLTDQIESIDIVVLQQAILIIKDYYGYLKQCGVTYGAIALDVVENTSGFGKFANLHLLNEAKHYGKAPNEITRLQAEYPVRLACSDAELRSGLKANVIGGSEETENKAVMEYHISALTIYKMDSCSWGGTFFEKFAGSGSWRDLSGYDLKPQMLIFSATTSLIKDVWIDGISARQCFHELIRTFIEKDISNYGITGIMQTAGYQVMVNRLVAAIRSEPKLKVHSEESPLTKMFGNFNKKASANSEDSEGLPESKDPMADLFANAEALANSEGFKSWITESIEKAEKLVKNSDWLASESQKATRIIEAINKAPEHINPEYANVFDIAAQFKNELEKAAFHKPLYANNAELPCCPEKVVWNLISCRPCNNHEDL